MDKQAQQEKAYTLMERRVNALVKRAITDGTADTARKEELVWELVYNPNKWTNARFEVERQLGRAIHALKEVIRTQRIAGEINDDTTVAHARHLAHAEYYAVINAIVATYEFEQPVEATEGAQDSAEQQTTENTQNAPQQRTATAQSNELATVVMEGETGNAPVHAINWNNYPHITNKYTDKTVKTTIKSHKRRTITINGKTISRKQPATEPQEARQDATGAIKRGFEITLDRYTELAQSKHRGEATMDEVLQGMHEAAMHLGEELVGDLYHLGALATADTLDEWYYNKRAVVIGKALNSM